LAHASEEDLDVGAGSDCGFEGGGFFFDGEADEGHGEIENCKLKNENCKFKSRIEEENENEG
jgi:hypothetical protein